MSKFFDFIIHPFAIIIFEVVEYITGKPFILNKVSQVIEDSLHTKIINIDVSEEDKNKNWKTYFITELKRKPIPSDIKIVSNALNVSAKNNIELFQDDSMLTVAIPKSTMDLIQEDINNHARLLFRYLK